MVVEAPAWRYTTDVLNTDGCDSPFEYPGPCAYQQKPCFLFRHRRRRVALGPAGLGKAVCMSCSPIVQGSANPANLQEGARNRQEQAGTGLGRVNIGGHLTRWPNPSTRVFRFVRARLAPLVASLQRWLLSVLVIISASRQAECCRAQSGRRAGAERGDTTPATAGHRGDRRCGEGAKTGKGK